MCQPISDKIKSFKEDESSYIGYLLRKVEKTYAMIQFYLLAYSLYQAVFCIILFVAGIGTLFTPPVNLYESFADNFQQLPIISVFQVSQNSSCPTGTIMLNRTLSSFRPSNIISVWRGKKICYVTGYQTTTNTPLKPFDRLKLSKCIGKDYKICSENNCQSSTASCPITNISPGPGSSSTRDWNLVAWNNVSRGAPNYIGYRSASKSFFPNESLPILTLEIWNGSLPNSGSSFNSQSAPSNMFILDSLTETRVFQDNGVTAAAKTDIWYLTFTQEIAWYESVNCTTELGRVLGEKPNIDGFINLRWWSGLINSITSFFSAILTLFPWAFKIVMVLVASGSSGSQGDGIVGTILGIILPILSKTVAPVMQYIFLFDAKYGIYEKIESFFALVFIFIDLPLATAVLALAFIGRNFLGGVVNKGCSDVYGNYILDDIYQNLVAVTGGTPGKTKNELINLYSSWAPILAFVVLIINFFKEVLVQFYHCYVIYKCCRYGAEDPDINLENPFAGDIPK